MASDVELAALNSIADALCANDTKAKDQAHAPDLPIAKCDCEWQAKRSIECVKMDKTKGKGRGR